MHFDITQKGKDNFIYQSVQLNYMAKSGYAIASVVCGILFFIPLLSILAIIFGIIALVKIKNNPSLEGKTLAIIGIVLGILGMVINVFLILMFIGAIAYFGAMSPDTLLPEKCSVPMMFNCKDYLITEKSVSMSLQNGAGRDMLLNNVVFSSDAVSGGSCKTNFGGVPLSLRNGDTAQITAPCKFADTGRSMNRYTFDIDYSWLDNPSQNHNTNGELLVKAPQ